MQRHPFSEWLEKSFGEKDKVESGSKLLNILIVFLYFKSSAFYSTTL
ncbi:hypothetical protein HMPREF0204_10832 [Chryseobacterium gleum ATCC 35910]|uniref:Uncharacterized protein n=1 Tax=Chryseobacterium gleum ATCC 35910 TaxID=525257 RepID=A0ABP2IWR8_CHRGE|nr:hypothetical protein HMPREF0204_10832 [Chryseobacterium gleum ATCC 35910]